jgi:hypothetical protein
MTADTRQSLADYFEAKARSHQRKAKRHKKTDWVREHRRSAAWLHRLARHVLTLNPDDWRLSMIGEAERRRIAPDVGGVGGYCITERIGSQGPVDLDGELRRFAQACTSYARTRDDWQKEHNTSTQT